MKKKIAVTLENLISSENKSSAHKLYYVLNLLQGVSSWQGSKANFRY